MENINIVLGSINVVLCLVWMGCGIRPSSHRVVMAQRLATLSIASSVVAAGAGLSMSFVPEEWVRLYLSVVFPLLISPLATRAGLLQRRFPASIFFLDNWLRSKDFAKQGLLAIFVALVLTLITLPTVLWTKRGPTLLTSSFFVCLWLGIAISRMHHVHDEFHVLNETIMLALISMLAGVIDVVIATWVSLDDNACQWQIGGLRLVFQISALLTSGTLLGWHLHVWLVRLSAPAASQTTVRKKTIASHYTELRTRFFLAVRGNDESSKELHDAFERYCKEHYTLDHFEFLRDVYALQDGTHVAEEIEESILRINTLYLLPGSPREINISEASRKAALSNSLKRAVEDVEDLLFRGCFEPFQQTPLFASSSGTMLLNDQELRSH